MADEHQRADMPTCPVCEARLVVQLLPLAQMVWCTSCGAQFRLSDDRSPERTSRMAVASMFLGLSSLICLFVTGLPAVLLGLRALGDIRRDKSLRGRSYALIGVALGGLVTMLLIAAPLVSIHYFRDRITLRSDTVFPPPVIPADAVVVIEPGVEWRWLHSSSGIDPEYDEPGFHQSFFYLEYDDANWSIGREESQPSGFGYGDDVAVDIGTPPSGLRKTAYFRHRFSTSEAFGSLLLTLYRDDGVIVYLDGSEVARDDVGPGAERYELRASRRANNRAETAVRGIEIPLTLKPGRHVLAMSLHNFEFDSSDLRVGDIHLYGVPLSK